MRRVFFIGCAILAGALVIGMAQTGSANSYPGKMAIPVCVELSDCIVLGRVTAIEEKPVSVPPFPGSPQKIEYRIAVVKIDEGLVGAKGLTQVRIAFQPPAPPPAPPKNQPGLPVQVGGGPGFRMPTLAVGQEGCFLLKRHSEDTFFRSVDNFYGPIVKANNADFDNKVALVKRCVKLGSDADAGLKSKDAGDRLLTAYLLLNRYRKDRGPKSETEPIDAAQSKLILEAIARADWFIDLKTLPAASEDLVTPRRVFYTLGPTAKDGWNPPQQGNRDFRIWQAELDAAAQKWLKDNTSTYRVQRWVPDKAGK
jgi:hypothetical protein